MNQYKYQSNYYISKNGFRPFTRYSTSAFDPSWIKFVQEKKLFQNQIHTFPELDSNNSSRFKYKEILFDIKNGIGHEDQYPEIKETGFLALISAKKFLMLCNVDDKGNSRNTKFFKAIDAPLAFCPASLTIDYKKNTSRVLNHQGRGRTRAIAHRIAFKENKNFDKIKVPVIISVNIPNNFWMNLNPNEKISVIDDLNRVLYSERNDRISVPNTIEKDLIYAS